MFFLVVVVSGFWFCRRVKKKEKMSQKQAEEAMVSTLNENEGSVEEREEEHDSGFTFKNFLWHGGSVWDAWFSCASNQV